MNIKDKIIEILESLDFLSENRRIKYLKELEEFNEEKLEQIYYFFHSKQEEYYAKLNIIIDKYKQKQENVLVSKEIKSLQEKSEQEANKKLTEIRNEVNKT